MTFPQGNFDGLLRSFITIFRLLTFDNWATVLWDSMRATSVWAAIYYIITLCIGVYLILNLFLAILLDNFSLNSKILDLEKQFREDAERAASAAALAAEGAGGADGGGSDHSGPVLRPQRLLQATLSTVGRHADALEHKHKIGLLHWAVDGAAAAVMGAGSNPYLLRAWEVRRPVPSLSVFHAL